MRRHTPRWLIALAVTVSFSAVALAAPPDFCEKRPRHPRCVTTTTVDTTTTTAPSTTTTVGSELVIPPTLPPDDPNFRQNESFTILTACLEDGTGACGGSNQLIAGFDYLGHGMPYLYPEAVPGMMNHAWWVAGDREGYACAFGFMYDQHPNPFGMFAEPRPAHFIARFSIVRPLGQSYGGVNDSFMEEGQRYYDGSPANEGAEIKSENCQLVALEPDFDYDNYVPHGADQIRVGLFRADGEIADVRDFTGLSTPGHFEFVSLEDGRASIVFVTERGDVSHVFYYDVLADGRIAVEVNGATIE